MKYRVMILAVALFTGCQERKSLLSEALSQIVKNELQDEINPDKNNYIYFLQNAACKCSEATLDSIMISGDDSEKNVIVVVNHKDHFALPQLQDGNHTLKLMGINELISYGFMQDKDVLVRLKGGELFYETL